MTRRRAVVKGRVQGVGFRWRAREMAGMLGLTGWVRNRPDGSVEIEFQGDDDRAADMEQWLHKGPRWAHVRSVDLEPAAIVDREKSFEIVR